MSQDLPGDSFVGPRFGCGAPPGLRPQPAGQRRKKAAALWELSEQLTDTKFALEIS